MASCTDILIALHFEMKHAKKPPTQRLTVNTQDPGLKIVFYAGEVEAQPSTQGLGVRFFDCPQINERSKSGVFGG